MSHRRSARRVVNSLSLLIDRARGDRQEPGFTVLLYHRIAPRESAAAIGLSTFGAQMDYLLESFRIVSISTVVEHLRAGKPYEPAGLPAVAITFDDGTEDFLDLAVPVMTARGIPSTLYLATAFPEQRRPFPGGHRSVSWSGLADAMATGLVDVGSHTHSHVTAKNTIQTIDTELQHSVDLIQQRLGVRAKHFAFPKGIVGTAAVDALIRSRFDSAALVNSRFNRTQDTDVFRLGRHPVLPGDDARVFTAKASGGLRFEGALRSALDRLRYRNAAN